MKFLTFITLSIFSILPALAEPISVYLLIGQSNMEGVGRCSKLTDAQKTTANVQIFHSPSIGKAKTANQWVPLEPAGFKRTQSGGFGLEISFGKSMHVANPTEQFALIKHAVGGTNLHSQWSPTKKGKQYKLFRKTANLGLSELKKQGSPTIKGILWQQGEADALNLDTAKQYQQNLANFIQHLRSEFAEFAEDGKANNIRFILGQVIPDYTEGTAAHAAYPGREIVRNAQLQVAEKLVNVYTIPTDTTFGTHASNQDGYRDKDNIHFNSDGLLKLGNEMAKAAQKKGTP